MPKSSVDDRPLSALLSQALVAFTIELNNEFEWRMAHSGYPGSNLSLLVWAHVMQFLDERAVSVREIADRASAPLEEIRHKLGCLERWRFIELFTHRAAPHARDELPHNAEDRRDGWGSGRGIRTDWIVSPTSKGAKAIETWTPLVGQIEERWRTRFGDGEIGALRDLLAAIADRIGRSDSDEPIAGLHADKLARYHDSVSRGAIGLPLPALMSRALTAFRIEFDGMAQARIDLSANTLRVLGEDPIRASDVPLLTGCSPETSDFGWRLKPYVIVERDPPAARGKVLRLSDRGLKARQAYTRLNREIEDRWTTKCVADIDRLREALLDLFEKREGGKPVIALGLLPPDGVVRSGDLPPALGRRDVGSAAKQRARDLVAQTEAFVRDPAGALPHYPMWDMNRGFGP